MAKCNTLIPNNIGNLPEGVKKRFDSANRQEKISLEGVACDKKLEPIPNYKKAPCEDVVANGQSNAQIVTGRDRPASLLSGYGGRGDAQAGSIDIVVGRSSSDVKELDEAGNKVFIDPDFEKDSARIHISQKTDIDNNFSIVNGGVGNSIARSGIGIKADGIRIVGREGIKLVTHTENKNSFGGDIVSTKGIDLIAGNNDAELQPLIKGDYLVEFLDVIVDQIKKINSLLNSMSTKQIALDAALASHTHPTVCAVGAGLATPSIEAGSACSIDSTGHLILDVPSQIAILTNTVTAAQDYIKPGGAKFIASKYNKTN